MVVVYFFLNSLRPGPTTWPNTHKQCADDSAAIFSVWLALFSDQVVKFKEFVFVMRMK